MKTILNKFSIWLYKKTRANIKSPEVILGGIEVLKSPYVPKGQCIIGIEDDKALAKSILDRDILLNER